MKKVYIIILNWNGLKDTIECLESVYKLDYPDFEVVLVDNFSTDNSIEIIKNNFVRVKILQNNKNLGFAGGNNVGIQYALKNNADYVWILNNDTVVESQSLRKIVETAESNDAIGLVSPAIFDYWDRESVQFVGCRIDFNRYSFTPVNDQSELSEDCKTCNLLLYGTAVLVKIKVVDTIGLFSEKYFAYVEDCDFSVRALRANFVTAIRMDAIIFHKGVQSSGKYSPMHAYLGTRNLYFFWMDNSKGVKKLLVPFNYIGMVLNYAAYLSEVGNERSVNACLNGFWAAVCNRSGEYDNNIIIPSVIKKLLLFFISWHPHFWSMLIKFNFRSLLQKLYLKISA